jgi:hypothetical protein
MQSFQSLEKFLATSVSLQFVSGRAVMSNHSNVMIVKKIINNDDTVEN